MTLICPKIEIRVLNHPLYSTHGKRGGWEGMCLLCLLPSERVERVSFKEFLLPYILLWTSYFDHSLFPPGPSLLSLVPYVHRTPYDPLPTYVNLPTLMGSPHVWGPPYKTLDIQGRTPTLNFIQPYPSSTSTPSSFSGLYSVRTNTRKQDYC